MFKLFVILNISFLVLSCSHSQNKLNLDTNYSGHGAESVPKEILTQFAPKELSPELSRKIQTYLDIRSPGLGKVTEDGKTLIFSWGVSGTRQIWKLNSPLSFPVQMTGGEDQTNLVSIAPNGKFILVSRDRKGEENPGLYWQSIAGGPLNEIQHLKGIQTSLQYITNDSKTIYFSSNDQSQDSYIIYKYEMDTKRKTPIITDPGLWGIDDVHPDGTFIIGKQIGSSHREFYRYSPITGRMTPILGTDDNEEYEISFGKTSNDFYVLTNRFGEFRRLYSFKNGRWNALTPEAIDLSSFAIDFLRKRIYISINDRGYTRLQAFSVKGFKKIKLPEFKGADHVYLGGISRNAKYITLGIETARAPRTNYVLNMDQLGSNSSLTQWVLSSSPEVDTTRFSPATLEYYTARDGIRIPMFVRRPANCIKISCPVIVAFHGGPEGMSTPGFSLYSQIFVDEGFVFVEPNVRGSDGYGKTWLHSDDASKRLKVITDIEDAAIYIKKNWAFNGVIPKIGVTGGSYGGYSTLYAMTKFAGSYQAGVANVGMSNLITFLKNTAPYRRKLRMTEYGDPEKDLDALVELSPSTHLDKAKDPLFIIQGASDPRVPVGEAIQIHEALKKKNIETDLMIFSDEGHGASSRKNQVFEIGHTLGFFRKHLR